jgi:hypothetical protein
LEGVVFSSLIHDPTSSKEKSFIDVRTNNQIIWPARCSNFDFIHAWFKTMTNFSMVIYIASFVYKKIVIMAMNLCYWHPKDLLCSSYASKPDQCEHAKCAPTRSSSMSKKSGEKRTNARIYSLHERHGQKETNQLTQSHHQHAVIYTAY